MTKRARSPQTSNSKATSQSLSARATALAQSFARSVAAAAVDEDGAQETLAQIKQLPTVHGLPIVGRYVLCALLGAGGAGAVFMGYHAKLRRRVAVKILNPSLVGRSKEAIERFEREAILSSKIESEFIVPVTDAGTVPGTDIHFLVMDLIDGENAQERVERCGPLSVPAALAVVIDATRGLVDAHRAEVIHRDLKPANIMISTDGRVRLADLGIAKSLEPTRRMVTQAEEFLGTPQYMSPEQIGNGTLDHRSDVYSMGVTLFYLLTGHHPFDGPTLYAIMQRVVNEPLPDIRTIVPDAPDAVVKVIRAATERERESRIASAEALLARLNSVAQRVGTDSLADPGAGDDRRALFQTLDEEELREFSREIDRAAIAALGVSSPRRTVAVLVALTLLVAVTIAGILFLRPTETPIDTLIAQAMEQDDVAMIAELLPQALTSGRLGDSARSAVVRGVSVWASQRGTGASTPDGAGDDSWPAIVAHLGAESDETFAQWVATEVANLVSAGEADSILRLLERLRSQGGPSELVRTTLARSITDSFIDRVRRSDGNLVVTDSELKVLAEFTANPRCAALDRLLRAVQHDSREPRVLEAIILEAIIDDARAVDVIDTLHPWLLAQIVRALDVSESQAQVDLLSDLVEAAPSSLNPVVTVANERATRAIGNDRWSTAARYITLLRKLPGTPASTIAPLYRAALDRMGSIATRGPLGTTRFSEASGEERAASLLEAMVDAGVVGAARWLVELRVEWPCRPHGDSGKLRCDDRMGFADGVSQDAKAAFPTLLERAIQESKPADQSRLLFIEAEYYIFLTPRADEDRRQRGLTTLLTGIERQNADSAARFLDQRRLYDDTEFERMLNSIGRKAPTWKTLDEIFATAQLRHASALSESRVLLWHAYGSLVYDPDARNGDPNLHSEVASKMLDAWRLGNTEAGCVALKLDRFLREGHRIETFLTAAQRAELAADHPCPDDFIVE